MATIKVSELKKQLKSYNEKELIQLITDLYKLDKNVQEYLSAKFLGEEAITTHYEKTKKLINQEFFPAKGHEKLRIGEAKKAINHFKKMTGDTERAIDLMLYLVEQGTEFTNLYGDIDGRFYDALLSTYRQVATACDENENLAKEFKDRLYRLVEESDGIGWGYHDVICSIYYSISTLEDDGE